MENLKLSEIIKVCNAEKITDITDIEIASFCKDTRIIKVTYLYILDKLSINPVLHTRKCNRDVLHCLHVDVPVPKPPLL